MGMAVHVSAVIQASSNVKATSCPSILIDSREGLHNLVFGSAKGV